MKKETVEAETQEEAQKLCPWAEVIIEVDSGGSGRAWMCFESSSDAETWQKQK